MNWLINHPHLSNNAKALIGFILHAAFALAIPIALLLFSIAFFSVLIALGIPT